MMFLNANIAGKIYRVRVSDFSETSGPRDPGINNQWTVYKDIFDDIGYGVLIDLGKFFGYRLTLRNERGTVTSQEFTRDQVSFTEANF